MKKQLKIFLDYIKVIFKPDKSFKKFHDGGLINTTHPVRFEPFYVIKNSDCIRINRLVEDAFKWEKDIEIRNALLELVKSEIDKIKNKTE